MWQRTSAVPAFATCQARAALSHGRNSKAAADPANAAGMDIGAEEIWVDVGDKSDEGVRRFGTFTADLNEMAGWMKGCGIETVAMERRTMRPSSALSVNSYSCFSE